jgi:hypothetical protein
MLNLEASQRAMQRALLDGDEAIVAEIVTAPPISPRERLKVYGDAYFIRLVEALRANYPKLHWILGDEGFDLMGREFARAHPSTTPSIRWFGRLLPGFLERTEPFADQPILAELARFEWLLSEVFDAADAVAVARSSLAAIDPNRWGEIRLTFHPAVRRTEFVWNTIAAWHAADADRSPADPERAERPTPWLLWRNDLQNYFRSLDANEVLAVDLALSGASFAEICTALTQVMPEADVPLHAATLLAAWTDSGMIAAID